jgi:hypothetical protein
MDETNLSKLMPGQLLARGVCRHLLSYDYVSVEELVPTPGRRVDVMALGPKGEIWIIECKSSRADFQSDNKWQDYLQWCDRYFWAVDQDFPSEILPNDTGLIVADAYDAAILRMGPEHRLAPARRKSMIQKFARHAARRSQANRDPGVARFSGSALRDIAPISPPLRLLGRRPLFLLQCHLLHQSQNPSEFRHRPRLRKFAPCLDQ